MVEYALGFDHNGIPLPLGQPLCKSLPTLIGDGLDEGSFTFVINGAVFGGTHSKPYATVLEALDMWSRTPSVFAINGPNDEGSMWVPKHLWLAFATTWEGKALLESDVEVTLVYTQKAGDVPSFRFEVDARAAIAKALLVQASSA